MQTSAWLQKGADVIASAIGPLPAVKPASTVSTAPEMLAAASEARNSTALAMSSGVAIRRSGYHWSSWSNTPGLADSIVAHASVLTVPGSTAFARMLWRAG